MIKPAYNCGCSMDNLHNNSIRDSCSNLSKRSSKMTSTSCSEEKSQNLCGCESDIEEETLRVVSEIVNNEMPYKEIEALINDNRVVVRIQKERLPVECEPPCDCIVEAHRPQSHNGNEVTFHKTENCRTISMYPQPTRKSEKQLKAEKLDKNLKREGDAKEHPDLPTVHPEENPNIFVLKIRRKYECADKKHNLDLEFRTPRPWRNRNW